MSTNVTDATVDAVVSAISTNVTAYFNDMDGTGYTLPDPKVVKKGPPNPVKWINSTVRVTAGKTVRVDRFMHRISVDVLYLIRDNDAERLAKTLARGSDALCQLIEDKFSTERLEVDFEYAPAEGNQEAAAQITVDIVV